jgi:hypothetical protein
MMDGEALVSGIFGCKGGVSSGGVTEAMILLCLRYVDPFASMVVEYNGRDDAASCRLYI